MIRPAKTSCFFHNLLLMLMTKSFKLFFWNQAKFCHQFSKDEVYESGY